MNVVFTEFWLIKTGKLAFKEDQRTELASRTSRMKRKIPVCGAVYPTTA